MDCFAVVSVLANWGEVLRTFGPLLVAVIFFIWRDYRREDKLSLRIEQLETEQRDVILPLVRETTEVIVRNTDVMKQNVRVMERLEHVLH